MTEPTYHFVKGRGWVPGDAYLTATVEVAYGGQLYRVTGEQRPPKLGERGWFASAPIDTVDDLIRVTRHVGFYHDGNYPLAGWECSKSNNYSEEGYSYYLEEDRSTIVTCFTECIGPATP